MFGGRLMVGGATAGPDQGCKVWQALPKDGGEGGNGKQARENEEKKDL